MEKVLVIILILQQTVLCLCIINGAGTGGIVCLMILIIPKQNCLEAGVDLQLTLMSQKV